VIPEDMVRINLNFSTVGEEIAVCSFFVKLNHEAGAPTNWPEMTQDLAQKTYEAWQSAFPSITQRRYFGAGLVLRDCSTYHLDAATAHTLDKGAFAPAPGSEWKGGGSNKPLPLEDTVVVSLYGYLPGTFVPDRSRKRGRMYLPPMDSEALTTDAPRWGRLAVAAQGDLKTAAGNFFNDMQGKTVGDDPLGIGQTWELVVLSRLGGFATPVQAIRVGDVIDTQRRRRNKLPEAYQDVAITR
jgi:hypothetical protein